MVDSMDGAYGGGHGAKDLVWTLGQQIGPKGGKPTW